MGKKSDLLKVKLRHFRMPFMPWDKNFSAYPCYNDSPVYNLAGQRVFKGYKGIAIKSSTKSLCTFRSKNWTQVRE